MALRFYNTLSRSVQEFTPIDARRTRVEFGETYHAFNPLLRPLLERYVHRFISKDNDRLVRTAIEQGVAAMRRKATTP